MADPLSDGEWAAQAKSRGWSLVAGDDAKHTGTLEEMARIAHERQVGGKHPGIVKQIETSIELEMLQLEQLWRYLGLPV